nr:basic proline-rich protein-like [Equus caballus]
MGTPQPTQAKEEGRRNDREWGSPPNPGILGPRQATRPSQTPGGREKWTTGDPGRLEVCKGVVGSGGRGTPQPPPAISRQPQVPSQHGPTAGAAAGTVEIPRAPSPREVFGCYPSTPRAAPPPPARGQKGEGLAGGWGAEPGSRAAGRPGELGASPRSAARRRGWGRRRWAAGSPGPDGSGQVQRPSPARAYRPRSARQHPPQAPRPAPPAPRPPRPRPHPGPAHPDPRLRPRRPASSTSFVNSSLPPAPPSGSGGPRAPFLQPRPPPASAGRTCARRRRRRSPAPFACAGAAPNPTHIATHSPLTSPSPRPAHVTAETHGFPQTPPPSPAARGRARAAGRGRGGARSQRRPARAGPPASPPPPWPRSSPSLREARAVWPMVAPPGSPRPGGSRARPSPRRAPGAPGPARRLGGWRAALSAVRSAQTGCSLPTPPPATRPPSFLESPSRLSGAATAPPPPHPLLCGDGPDPGAPWPLGRRAPGERGQGGRAVHCARPQQPAGPGRGRGGGRGPPAERRRPRSGAGDPPPAGRSWAAPPRRQPGGGRPAAPPGWALLAGAAPRPRGASSPRPAPPAACAPPRPARPGRLPRLTSLRHRAGPEAGQSSGETERNIFVPTSQPRFPPPPPSDCPLGSKGSWKSHVSTVFTEGFGGFVLEENTR